MKQALTKPGEPWVLNQGVDVECETMRTVLQTVLLDCAGRNSGFLLRLKETGPSECFADSGALCTE